MNAGISKPVLSNPKVKTKLQHFYTLKSCAK